MTRQKISAKELLADIRGGMDDPALMTEHGLSSQGLDSVLNKMVAANVLHQSELDGRTPVAEKTVDMGWKCPACAMPQERAYDECPQCGIIVVKFTKQQARLETENPRESVTSQTLGGTGLKETDSTPIKSIADQPLTKGVAEAGNKAAEAVGEVAGSAMAELVGSLFRF